MNDCIFCKIIEGTIPSTKVFESDRVIAFKDLRPQASRHYLFVHRSHSRDVNAMDPKHIGEVYTAIREFTQKDGIDQKGFRVVTNLGSDAGQTVFHTHFHVLGGEPLGLFGK